MTARAKEALAAEAAAEQIPRAAQAEVMAPPEPRERAAAAAVAPQLQAEPDRERLRGNSEKLPERFILAAEAAAQTIAPPQLEEQAAARPEGRIKPLAAVQPQTPAAVEAAADGAPVYEAATAAPGS